MKDRVYSVRLEENDFKYYKWLRATLNRETGIPISTTWIVAELLRMGMPVFEKKYNLKRPKEFALDDTEPDDDDGLKPEKPVKTKRKKNS